MLRPIRSSAPFWDFNSITNPVLNSNNLTRAISNKFNYFACLSLSLLGHKELAIELYRKGIKELEDGIAVDCWSGRGDVWDRAQRLHDKMQTNLSMARDRLHFLGK